MERVWMPSSCFQPAISLTAAVRTIATSWRISSCKNESDLLAQQRAAFVVNLNNSHWSKKMTGVKWLLVINARKRGGNPTTVGLISPCVPSGTSSAAWSCWSQKITWLFISTEQLPAGRCLASSGWRDATRWLTGSENDTTVLTSDQLWQKQKRELVLFMQMNVT